MTDTKEKLIADFQALMGEELSIQPFAARAEAAGFASLARFFRAIHTSEKIRRQLISGGIMKHKDDELDFFVCPHCGLLFIPEPPETCPVDETPGKDFLRAA